MKRREFILASSSFAVCGCRSTGATDAFRAAMRRCIDTGLYSGLAAGSNRIAPLVVGSRTLDGRLPVTTETLFDLASVGKTQTAALCALLVADGKLDPDAPFTEYLTEHVLAKENCRITVRDLATHSGGFDNAKPYKLADHKRMFEELYRKRPVRPRGEKFEYACSNFFYLGLIVEKLTGQDLDAAAKRMLWGPLGMTRTTWNTVTDDGDVIAVDPERDFAGVVLGGQVAGKAKTMDVRVNLLRMMA